MTALSIVVLAGLTACVREILPLPAGAERFEPLLPYGVWWDMVRECSQRNGDLADVAWYYVPGTDSIQLNGEWVDGYWSRGGNTIVVSSRAQLNGQVIRHEMLHALTGGSGHGREYFVNRCGGVVSCTGSCVTEAGTPADPPDGAPLMPVRHLRVTARVYPDAPTYASDSGFVAVSVTVTNDSSYDAWIALDSVFISPNRVVTFRALTMYPGGGGNCSVPLFEQSLSIWNDQRFGIPAHTTRRQVFDFRFSHGDGNVCIRSYFNADTAPVLQFTSAP